MLMQLRSRLPPKLSCYNFLRATFSTEKQYNRELRMKIQEEKVKIDKYYVNYFQVGRGPHIVLCVPGAFGTFGTDFTYQVEGFDLEKFTLFGYDTPGFGKSRPPERDYMRDTHYYDADIVRDLMKLIGVPEYSVMGWSYGGISSLIHAAKCPENVKKLVVWGAQSHYLPEEIQNFKNLEDMSRFPPNLIRTRIEIHGQEAFQKQCSILINAMTHKYKSNGDDICSDLLQHIRCPTFILHGAKDVLVDGSHVTYLNSHIENSRTHVYPDGKHSVHWGCAEDFNKRVQEFLLES